MARRNYYEILGVDRDADRTAIKRAYRRLALQHHPDRHRGARSAAFLKIQEAYAVLFDPERRRQYDLTRPTRARRPSTTKRADAAQSAAVTTRRLVSVVIEGLGLSVGVSLGTRSVSKPVQRRRSAPRGSRTSKAQ